MCIHICYIGLALEPALALDRNKELRQELPNGDLQSVK